MIVCQCAGVTDCTIRMLIDSGASSIDQITEICGAGACCEPCRDEIASLLYSTPPATHTPTVR